MDSLPTLIVITGPTGAGKDALAEVITQHHPEYAHVRISDPIKQIARDQWMNPNDKNVLIQIGRYLSLSHPPEHLADLAIRSVSSNRSLIITGCRQPAQVQYLCSLWDRYRILIFGVVACRITRLARMQSLHPEMTFEDLVRIDQKNNSWNPQSEWECLKLAQYILYNHHKTSPEELYTRRVQSILQSE